MATLCTVCSYAMTVPPGLLEQLKEDFTCQICRSTIVPPVIFVSALLGAKCVLTSGTKEWMGWHGVVLFVGLRGLSLKPLCSVDWTISSRQSLHYWEAANQMIPTGRQQLSVSTCTDLLPSCILCILWPSFEL